VRELGTLAEAMMKRYAHHPAVIAVGYNNEIGNGFSMKRAGFNVVRILSSQRKAGSISIGSTRLWTRCSLPGFA
jgi:hypothetical protein